MPLWRYRWRGADLAETGFPLAQGAAVHEGGEADQVVILTTWSGNDLRRLAGGAASGERPTLELALAVGADWRADG